MDNVNTQVAINNAVKFSSAIKGFKLVGDDELTAGGKMYDIVSKNIINGVTIYYATGDEEEDGILTKLSIPGKNSAGDRSLAAKRIKVHDLNYPLLKPGKYPTPVFSKTAPFGAFDNPAFYRAWFRAILSPPPEYCYS